MIKRIFEGIHWPVGQPPHMFHSGRVLPLDKVAKSILAKPHGANSITVTCDGVTLNIIIPYYISARAMI